MLSRFYWERQRKQRDFHKTTFPILFLTLVGSSRSICPRSYSAIICLRVNHTIMSASKQSMSPFDFGLCFLYRPGPWGLASSSEHCCASRSAKVCFYLFLLSSFGKPSFMVCFYDHSFMTSLSSYSKDTINVDVLKVLRKALYIQPGKRMKVKGYGLSYSSLLHSLARDWTTRFLPAHYAIIQRVFVEEKSAFLDRVQSTAMKKKCVTKQPVVPRPIGMHPFQTFKLFHRTERIDHGRLCPSREWFVLHEHSTAIRCCGREQCMLNPSSSSYMQFNDKRAKSLRSLISPLRQTTPIGTFRFSSSKSLELWSPYEVAVFESSISVIGKDFFTIAKLVCFFVVRVETP